MKQLICFGDSNTYGYDPRSYFGDRYGKMNRWTGIIENKTGFKVVNQGTPGLEIPKSIYQINNSVSMLAKICDEDSSLIIMLGSNDLMDPSHPTAEKVTNNMKNFIMELLKWEPFSQGKVPITLISPPLMTNGTWTDDECIRESYRIGSCMRKLAEQLKLNFLDAAKWNLPVCFDGVHLTEEAHHHFAEQVMIELDL